MNECVMTGYDMLTAFLSILLAVGMLILGLAAGVAIKGLINLLRRK